MTKMRKSFPALYKVLPLNPIKSAGKRSAKNKAKTDRNNAQNIHYSLFIQFLLFSLPKFPSKAATKKIKEKLGKLF